MKVRSMLGQPAVAIAQIAKETGPDPPQTVYRIKDDPAGAEAALAASVLGTADFGNEA